jgi:hypothetical protein
MADGRLDAAAVTLFDPEKDAPRRTRRPAMLVAPPLVVPCPVPPLGWPGGVSGEPVARSVGRAVAAVDPEDDEELADDDLPLAEPAEEESNFDDFDDEFDDDFEEEEDDPDWDHPDEGEAPPPAKGPGGKK